MKYWYADAEHINIKISVSELLELERDSKKLVSRVRTLVATDSNLKELKCLKSK